MPGYVANYDGSAVALIMGGTSFSFPTAPSVQGDVLAYHVASAALLPTSRAWAIAATSTAGITLANTTAATAGVPVQYSPALQLDGTALDTDGAGTNVTERWRIDNRPTSAATVTSLLSFSRAVDAGAFAQAASISSGGVVSALGFYGTGYCSHAAYDYLRLADLGTGHGTTGGVDHNYNSPVHLINRTRADGANNIVVANIYDRNAASITNAATMRLWSGGWTNNADAYTELGALYCDGSLWLSGGNSYSDDGSTATGGVHYGAGLMVRNLSAVLTIAAAATTTSTVTIPAGAVVLGVSCRVTTVIPTAATFTIGHAGSAALWGTGISTAAGTTNTGAAVPALFAAATAVLITPNASPADNSGRLRICIHYYLPTAPTS